MLVCTVGIVLNCHQMFKCQESRDCRCGLALRSKLIPNAATLSVNELTDCGSLGCLNDSEWTIFTSSSVNDTT